VCDYCDPNHPDKRHPAEFAVDGAETWWQSPPLSRGVKYNEVNLTIDLGQVSSSEQRPGWTNLIQGDQKLSVHLMVTIQKVTINVQSVPHQSLDIY
jgi:hypothetical protein